MKENYEKKIAPTLEKMQKKGDSDFDNRAVCGVYDPGQGKWCMSCWSAQVKLNRRDMYDKYSERLKSIALSPGQSSDS